MKIKLPSRFRPFQKIARMEADIAALKSDVARLNTFAPQPLKLRRRGVKVVPTSRQWQSLDSLAARGLTLEQIACLAGVSTMTLGRLIRDRHGVRLAEWKRTATG